MYCKVRKDDEIYYSPVLIVDSNKGEFVVFNKECSGFEKTGVSGENNNALIIIYDCSDFVMPDKNKENLGLVPVFLLIRRCVRVLYASINALTRLVLPKNTGAGLAGNSNAAIFDDFC